MKLIHCADIHLDSRMQTHMPERQASARNAEITKTFLRLTEYAKANGIRAVLVAGDLFDSQRTSRNTVSMVLHAISATPEVDYLYLRGNHDEAFSALADQDLPNNLKLFSDRWQTVCYDDVCIYGIEITAQNADTFYDDIPLQADRKNIVMLHGQVSTQCGPDMINLTKLRGRNIQYLALGHLHTFQTETLHAGCVYCYPGCLEGRGFDECGPKGFAVLDTDARQIVPTFVPFSKRALHRVEVDISGCATNSAVYELIKKQVAGISHDDMVECILTGHYTVDANILESNLQNLIAQDFYFAKVKNTSTLAIDPADYKNDISLKGEFIRLVLASGRTEKEKSAIIRAGLQALSEEDINL